MDVAQLVPDKSDLILRSGAGPDHFINDNEKIERVTSCVLGIIGKKFPGKCNFSENNIPFGLLDGFPEEEAERKARHFRKGYID
jgi:hypothetical protein